LGIIGRRRGFGGGQGLKFLPVAVTVSMRSRTEGSIEIEFAGSVRVRVDET